MPRKRWNRVSGWSRQSLCTAYSSPPLISWRVEEGGERENRGWEEVGELKRMAGERSGKDDYSVRSRATDGEQLGMKSIRQQWEW